MPLQLRRRVNTDGGTLASVSLRIGYYAIPGVDGPRRCPYVAPLKAHECSGSPIADPLENATGVLWDPDEYLRN